MKEKDSEDEPIHVVEAIYEALDERDPERALDLARRHLDREGEDPVLSFLSGIALIDLGRSDQAVEALREAVRLDPEDVDFRANLALALFQACRFSEAEQEVKAALRKDPESPDAHNVQGLLLERKRAFPDADRHFARAARSDPERFPAPSRVDESAFHRALDDARGRLPPEFRAHLERVAVLVEDVPSEDLLREEQPPLDPELLGLFAGVSLGSDGPLSVGGELPSRIYLFQRNLERFASGSGDLVEQIAVTLYHELGHYLGLDESELEELDFG